MKNPNDCRRQKESSTNTSGTFHFAPYAAVGSQYTYPHTMGSALYTASPYYWNFTENPTFSQTVAQPPAPLQRSSLPNAELKSSLKKSAVTKPSKYVGNTKKVGPKGGTKEAGKTKKKQVSSCTAAFDNNTELLKRINELEAELAEKTTRSNKGTSTVKPNDCVSSSNIKKEDDSISTPVKKEPGTPKKGSMFSPRRDRMWMEMFGQLEEYKLYHGHTMVPVKQRGLGSWVSTQRQIYKQGKMSEERKALLNAIDFVWVAK